MNRTPPNTPSAFSSDPPVCTIDERMFLRLQWLIYGGMFVIIVGVLLAIYKLVYRVLIFSLLLTRN